MGLDMYVLKKKDIRDEDEEADLVGYWRKHPDLHKHIEGLYEKNGGTGEFNCKEYVLSEEEISEIIEKSKNRQLAKSEGGFFFGESEDEDYESTVEIMEKALKEIKQGYTVYYYSWW